MDVFEKKTNDLITNDRITEGQKYGWANLTLQHLSGYLKGFSLADWQLLGKYINRKNFIQ